MVEPSTFNPSPAPKRRRRIYTFDGRPEKVTLSAILVTSFLVIMVLVPLFALFAIKFGD